jgi:hypothetical protein
MGYECTVYVCDLLTCCRHFVHLDRIHHAHIRWIVPLYTRQSDPNGAGLIATVDLAMGTELLDDSVRLQSTIYSLYTHYILTMYSLYIGEAAEHGTGGAS